VPDTRSAESRKAVWPIAWLPLALVPEAGNCHARSRSTRSGGTWKSRDQMSAVQPGVSNASSARAEANRRKPVMERVIDALSSGLGNSVAWMAESGVLFAVFAVIWVAFATGLVWSHGTLDQAWQAIRGLP